MPRTIQRESKIFETKKFTPKMLEEVLWDTLRGVQKGKVDLKEANSVISSVKEICNLARLRLQYRLLASDPRTRLEIPGVIDGSTMERADD